jgi:hypothetical protein
VHENSKVLTYFPFPSNRISALIDVAVYRNYRNVKSGIIPNGKYKGRILSNLTEFEKEEFSYFCFERHFLRDNLISIFYGEDLYNFRETKNSLKSNFYSVEKHIGKLFKNKKILSYTFDITFDTKRSVGEDCVNKTLITGNFELRNGVHYLQVKNLMYNYSDVKALVANYFWPEKVYSNFFGFNLSDDFQTILSIYLKNGGKPIARTYIDAYSNVYYYETKIDYNLGVF